MNSVTLAFMIAGLLAFAAGAWFAATGERTAGIGFMMGGLAMQVLTLIRLKQEKKKGMHDAGR
jgi:hypothetical protein